MAFAFRRICSWLFDANNFSFWVLLFAFILVYCFPAAFWLVAGSIMPDSEIRLEGTGLNPTRTGLMTILKEMGADITIENERMEGAEPVGDIVVRSAKLRKIDIKKELILEN